MPAVRRRSSRLLAMLVGFGVGVTGVAASTPAHAADHPVTVGESIATRINGSWLSTISTDAASITVELPAEAAGFYYPRLTWSLGGWFAGIGDTIRRTTATTVEFDIPADFFATTPAIQDSDGVDDGPYYMIGVSSTDAQWLDVRVMVRLQPPSGVTHETYLLTSATAQELYDEEGDGFSISYTTPGTPSDLEVTWGDSITVAGNPGAFTTGPENVPHGTLHVQLQASNVEFSYVAEALVPTVNGDGSEVTFALPAFPPPPQSGGVIPDWGSGSTVIVELVWDGPSGHSAYTPVNLNFGGPWRIAGDDRFSTSAAVALKFDTASTVYIANGRNYPDALSAAPAAAHLNAPLLLTEQAALPDAIANEIGRLKPDRVVIVGGTNAISAGVEAELEHLVPGGVDRISGANRYETSRAISADAFGTAATAFIATGNNFPDALAASAAADHFDAPVILVPGTATSVDDATHDLLDDLGTNQIYIAGGTAVVSDEIADDLSAAGTVERLAGASRYDTAIAINAEAFQSPTVVTDVYLAVGTGYADALSGAALAGKNNAPLFVVPGNCVPAGVLSAIAGYGDPKITLFGGKAVLGVGVEALTSC